MICIHLGCRHRRVVQPPFNGSGFGFPIRIRVIGVVMDASAGWFDQEADLARDRIGGHSKTHIDGPLSYECASRNWAVGTDARMVKRRYSTGGGAMETK